MIDGIDPTMSEDEQQRLLDSIADALRHNMVDTVTAFVDGTLSFEARGPKTWALTLLARLDAEGFHVSREAA